MRLLSLSFLSGTLLLQLFSSLPSLIGVTLVLISSILTTVYATKNALKIQKILLAISAFLAGLFLASVTANTLIKQRISPEYEGVDILAVGQVISIPQVRSDGIRFRFNIDRAMLNTQDHQPKPIALSGVVRVGWYKEIKDIHAGEQWQLRLRLKQPSGFANPGGFDYEKWLFTQRIIGTGYVRNKSLHQNYRLDPAPWYSINQLRATVAKYLQDTLRNKESAAVLSALVVAVRDQLNDSQWQLFQNTGTSHLIAISGLHIAVIAGFTFLPIMLIWRLFPSLNEKLPVRIAGALAGVVAASLYALLAGFGLPTQRALLMVLIALFGLLYKRNLSSSQILALALLGVLLLDPLAGMTISFWLSFLAVSIILILLKRQFKPANHALIRVQIGLSLAMIPLTLFFFDTASVIAPVANLIAIPWVSLVIVPVSLLGTVLLPLSDTLAHGLFLLASMAVDGLVYFLKQLNALPFTQFSMAAIPKVYLLLAFTGLLILMLPRGFPGRWLGLVLMVPAAILVPPGTPHQGEFRFTLLDAGQGMASVIQTQNHVLIYDVGTRLNPNFDVGKLVVVPFLQSQGIGVVNTMILSHEDIDHRGGAQTVLDNVKVNKVISSDVTIPLSQTIRRCVAGDTWQWDQVRFEILSPPDNYPENDNNRSCVLRISNASHSLLLTGDIQRKTEMFLLDNYPEKIASEVLLVPHHGSRTSSTRSFIEAVSPQLAVIPVGYRNRFGHPKADVLARYKSNHSQLFDTVHSGAIMINFNHEQVLTVHEYRRQNARFWFRHVPENR